jgi:peptidoglycan hydrolase-like protein with peptidoglycan-binding domain
MTPRPARDRATAPPGGQRHGAARSAPPAGPARPGQELLTLQAAAGNQAVGRLVDGRTVQRLVPLPSPEGGGSVPPGPLPAVAHPTLRRGSRGPAVEELQTKLNNVGATPPLAADGIFGPLTKAAVVAFQSANTLAPAGVAGPLTWGVLDAAQPGGPGSDTDTDTSDLTDTDPTDTTDGDATDEEVTPLALIRGRPQAPPVTGTGTHPTLRLGDRGPAVEELQEKLNPATPFFPGPPIIPITGIFDQRTEDEVKAVQVFINVPATGVVDDRTWEALDVFHPGTSVGRVEKKWQEVVEGETFGLTSRYTWRITAGEVRVTVTLAFTGDTTTTPNLNTFITQIRAGIADHWNRFAARDEFTGDTLPIVFDMQPVTGPADNAVVLKHCVNPANEGCRSNAGNWFVDVPAGAQSLEYIAAHEFGHMIGLEDEYKRGHGDFRRVTGDDAQGTPHPNPDLVATELNEALHGGEIPILGDLFASGDDRADECERIVTRHNLTKGASATSVADSYQRLFPEAAGRDDALVQEVIDELPAARQGRFVELFTLSSSSLMGQTPNQSSASAHDHPIEARHVREFVEAVQKFRPAGVWGAVRQR